MSTAPLWITEADVTRLLSLPDAVEALEKTLVMEAKGQAENMGKTLLMVGQNDPFQALGGSVAGAGVCGTKTWVNVSGKSNTILVLFGLEDGANLAVIEATALGQMRTAAMTGVGTRRLAPEGADDMVIIGTGKQALTQVAACHAVRPLKRLRIFSRNPENRAQFGDAVRAHFDFEIVLAESLEQAVDGAPIVTVITNSQQPIISAGMLTKGAHVNAMGAIVPRRKEFTDDVFDRADLVAVDSVPAVRELSAEFIAHYGEDEAAWAQVQPICSLVAAGTTRPAGADLTLFKAMGMGISDLALGIEILARARAEGAGHVLPERIRKPIRLVR